MNSTNSIKYSSCSVHRKTQLGKKQQLLKNSVQFTEFTKTHSNLTIIQKQNCNNFIINKIFKSSFDDETLFLLYKMLEMDPNRRFTAQDILQSSYFQNEPAMCDSDGIPKDIKECHEFKTYKKELENQQFEKNNKHLNNVHNGIHHNNPYSQNNPINQNNNNNQNNYIDNKDNKDNTDKEGREDSFLKKKREADRPLFSK